MAEEWSDETCFHPHCCCPCLRTIPVTEPVFGCIFRHFTFETIFWLITITVLSMMAYILLWLFMGDVVLPGGPIFGLFCTIFFAYLLGWTLAYLPFFNLPPVFGMLLAGILSRNLGWYDINEKLGIKVSSKIRNFSVTFVLLRAGLQLTSSAIREHPLFVLNLAMVPCTMELLTVAIFCNVFLDYPWGWAFLCGSIVACMSPVVPVNCMLALAHRGYGEDKEIASLLFAAVSIDDVHIISIFAICYGFVFSHDQPRHWLNYMPSGIRDLIIGFIAGVTLGFFFVFFPHRSNNEAIYYRVVGLVLGSLMFTTGATAYTITGAGFLAVIFMSLVATNGWRILSNPYDIEPLRNVVSVMWHIMQPVLVAVIGAEIDLKNWSSYRLYNYLMILLLGLSVRSAFAYLATYHTQFTTKERIFIVLSWISKGTIQAALGPMLLEHAIHDKNEEEFFFAQDIERIAVLAIMIFAPLGALIMMTTGPHLLNKLSDEELKRRRELSLTKIVSLQPIRRLTSGRWRSNEL